MRTQGDEGFLVATISTAMIIIRLANIGQNVVEGKYSPILQDEAGDDEYCDGRGDESPSHSLKWLMIPPYLR